MTEDVASGQVEPTALSDVAWWEAPVQFAVHAIVGILIFGVIAAAALVFDFCVNFLEKRGMNSFIVLGMRVAEYSFFAADLGLFLVFIARTASRTFRRL